MILAQQECHLRLSPLAVAHYDIRLCGLGSSSRKAVWIYSTVFPPFRVIWNYQCSDAVENSEIVENSDGDENSEAERIYSITPYSTGLRLHGMNSLSVKQLELHT